jgi:ubiquinone/menaquinone biosynthesis C-methylase UbiE
MIKKSFKKTANEYLIWGVNNPIGSIPAGVAKEGAGENRIPFAHLANSVPVYIFFKELLIKSKKNTGVVVDIGCGTGRNISFVKNNLKKNFEFSGIDYSSACINFAKSQYKDSKIKFKKHNGKIFPFKDNSVDFIVSSHVIEHIPINDVSFYINEIDRVLKKDGLAVVGTPNRIYCQDLFCKNPQDNIKYRLIIPHVHEYYPKELKDIFLKDKLFKKVDLYFTSNKLNLGLMKKSIDRIKPKKDLFSKIVFSVYSQLRKKPFLQDLMARVGTEYMLRRMGISYKKLIESTNLIKFKTKENIGENLIVRVEK